MKKLINFFVQLRSKADKKTYFRTDFDIALLRLDYPIADFDTGLGVLQGTKFNTASIMPICLPPDKDFPDTNRQAIAVGLGIVGERDKKGRCFTDGNGPVVFQQCSTRWVLPNNLQMDEYNEFTYVNNMDGHRCSTEHPPSYLEPLCRKYHQRIQKLK